MSLELANFWVNLLLAGTTFFAVIVALFEKRFWDWVDEPELKVEISNEVPNIVQGLKNHSVVFYFRMRVINVGKTIAKNCHAKIISVIPEIPTQNLYFEPDDLKWSSAPRDMNYRINPEGDINSKDKTQLTPIFREFKDISPNKGWEFCDLFEICNGFVTFASSGVRLTLTYYQSAIVTVEIFGDNVEPKEIKFRISPSKDFRQVRIDRIR